MVEFVFTFAMLVVFFMALLMFGWVFFAKLSITNAARDGARHLLAHPLVPADQTRFTTADEEAIWVITNSLPLLDQTSIIVNTSPITARIPGGYVAVEIQYTVPLPQFQVPLGFDGTTFTLLGPIDLEARSIRSLD